MKNNFIVKTIKKETIAVEGKLIKSGAKKQPTIKELIYSMNERMNHEFKQIHGEFGKVHSELSEIKGRLNNLENDMSLIKSLPTIAKEIRNRKN